MMKRETKRRIAYYQEALPDMKKKVAAAALMLMIAVIVSVTATYAWITLSVAPVVSSVNTTMSANGTLEIALSNPEGTEPEDMDIDESVTSSTDVAVSNLRWGNLINLSHTSYGIDNLVLRPAQLNTASLKNSPLWGAVYGADGRISTLDSNYTYTKWDGVDFMASREYGVRAIASYKAGASAGTTAEYNRMAEAVNVANRNVNNAYQLVPGKMPAMSNMLSSFAQSKLDDAEKAFTSAELKAAYELYKAVYDAMLLECDAMVALANFQSYVAAQNDLDVTYVPLTWEELVAGKANYNAADTTTKSKNGIVSITGLNQFISDLNIAKTDVECLEKYYKGVGDGSMTVYWSTGGDAGHQIANIVTNLLDYGTMTMVFNGQEQKLVSLNTSMAMDMLGLNGKHTNVYIYGGVLKRFEQQAIDESARMQGQTNAAVATVKVTYIITVTVHGDCYTKATGASNFMSNYATALGNKLIGTDVVAEDTYGMAVDFWLRTNAEETYLTLEGAMATEADGTIYSYDGVNRVWGSTGNTALTTNSTTQGGGSCYIYYADTPEDMMRSLDLLRSMKVAFVDKNGTMLALASMDTDSYYAVNGRITVPLAIEETSGVPYTYIDETQAECTGRAVTMMTHDESMWVTAIIYLDGAYLGNDNVLSAADIDGQLNIQFGSSVDLETVGDSDLLTAERSVSADADPKSLDWAAALTDADLTTNVTVTVDGTEPETVTAFFVRAINSTQGERQAEMTFTEVVGEKGKWTASYKFDAPGVYYLRHVRLDGVDYTLEDPVKVEVEGFSISEVRWGESEAQTTIYTPDSAYETTVSAKITSDNSSKLPKTVQARFLRDDGIMVNVDMRYDPSGIWSGTGTFYRSGTYALQYMLLDGEYYDITERGYELTLYLGLSVAAFNDGSTLQDEYDPDLAPYSKNVGVIISDNDGNKLPVYEYDEAGNIETDSNGNPKLLSWAENARLRYSPGSSAVNSVDTDLTWNEAEGWFTGTLPIVNPGRYTFYDVTIDGDSLTRATEAPVFTVMPPDPPKYVTSQSAELQFAPLTNDGIIGPINITDAQTAALVAEVYNSVSKQTYLIPNSAALDTYLDEDENFVLSEANGLMTYDSARDSWVITPKYTAGGAETQEGVWSVKNIYVWNFMAEDGTLVEYDRHEVWSDSSYNFSGLTTEISCSLNVTMEPGTTTLGSATTPFMTSHYVKDIGMTVRMLDNAGRTITGSVMDKMSITMKVDYNSNTGGTDTAKTAELVAAYGYEVSGATNRYTINFVYDADENCWVVNESDSNHRWQYVGAYPIYEMTVAVNGNILPAEKISGVPEMYKIVSETPTVDNLTIGTFTQGKTVFGKDNNGNVTGLFLDGNASGRELGQISVILQYFDEVKGEYQPASAAVIPITVTLELVHKGNNEAYGGYTWEGSNALSAITVKTSRDTNGVYTAGITPLLAGTYTVEAVVECGGQTERFTGQNISVYSKSPTVKVTGVSPNINTGYNINLTTTGGLYYYANAEITSVQNYYSDYLANVYIQATEKYDSDAQWGGSLVDYTLPKVSLTLSDMGSKFGTATAGVTGTQGGKTFTNTFEFSASVLTDDSEIGLIDSSTFSYQYDTFLGAALTRNVTYETRHWLGEKQITSIQAIDNVVDATGNKVNSDVVYTVTLEKPVTVRENNEAMPSITYAARDGYITPEAVTSETGGAFQVTLPQSIGTTQKEEEVTDNSAAWEEVSSASDVYMYYKVTNTSSRVNNGSCGSSDTYYSTYEFTYYLYSRPILVEKTTTTTTLYNKTFGVTGWKIGDKTYAPGETITVSGVVTASPVIGEISKTPVGEPSVKTLMRTTTGPDIGPTTKVVSSGEQSSTTSAADAAAKAAARYTASGVKPSGSWLDSNDHTSSAKVMTQATVEIVTQAG